MRLLRSFAAMSVVVSIAACGDSTAPFPPEAQGNAQVRYVNSTADTASLDFVQGSAAAIPLAYGAVSPAQTTTPAYNSVVWNSNLVIRATGGTAPFFTGVAGYEVGKKFTLISYGESTVDPSLPGPQAVFGFIALPDTTAGAASNTLVRIYNALDYMTNTGDQIDVYMYPVGAARPPAPDAAALARLARTPYLLEPATGTLNVEVFLANANPATSVPLVTATVTAGANKAYTIVVGDPRPLPALPFPGQAASLLPQCGVPAGLPRTGGVSAAPPATCAIAVVLPDL